MGRREKKVELFEEIRREYEQGVGTIRGVAKKVGVHLRMVREALESSVPKERKQVVRKRPKLGAVQAYIEAILEEDQHAPRKQRHTAHRIWSRLREEIPGLEVGESTVREYVRVRKHDLGLMGRETFIPQTYHWGVEGQVDWYDADHQRAANDAVRPRSYSGIHEGQ